MKAGIVLADKPEGLGSALLTSILKRHSGVRVGHTGTLDRFASGLMLLVVGAATSLAEHFLHQDKAYLARFAFGRSTDTLDPTGETTAQRGPQETQDFVSGNAVRLAEFVRGWTALAEQSPPAFSALKQGGRRFSDRARRGEQVRPDPRPIRVLAAEAVACNGASGSLDVELRVSSGTYVRSFAELLAAEFDFPVHLSRLQRTAVGRFRLDDPRIWRPPPKKGDPVEPPTVLGLAECLEEWPRVAVSDEQARRLRQGQRIKIVGCPAAGSFLFCDPQGAVVAWALGGEGGAYALRKVFL